MAFTELPPNLPPVAHPVLDAQGRMDKVWYDYFAAMIAYLKRMAAAIP